MLQPIFELLQQGHPDALKIIYTRYHRRIYWLGKQLIKDEFVIENILQDTFLKLWENREGIEHPEHIYFFLRYVMKRDCTFYYCRPRHNFYRGIGRLEYYEDYQEYMHGYDPEEKDEHLMMQEANQKAFDRIQNVLPLLSSERKRLIELCLNYGFQYKAIAQTMGTSITKTSTEVKSAINDIKNIINKGSSLEAKPQPMLAVKIQGTMTWEQEKVLQLRTEKQYSFAAIAKELNLSKKEVHKEFMAAYKLTQLNYEQQSA
ncbi:RNA polymerase sigma factor [Salegentibacter salegens]|uniref:RNA polymerase sigma factor, sigma-70 family n=1 Tax=Salegentibacter salegens TaxID=143223 RepID=A0A1M7KSW3_9FLAO|nr:sigma-70 family RNA polymerase sigma factor [Salegentibacter salegens]PRX48816.1 RNA polymerase sigma factor (sigma-70 family) [Salegentibacter salegens]SHM68570.1 RNA polymerase sigma factor, sigma-70 family [Salegentibacter salegens]